MSADQQQAFKSEVTACLRKEEGIVALLKCIADHFPDFEVFRESDDLVIKHGGRFLIVRRVGADLFRTAEYVEAPSTNEVDFGGGTPHDVDSLFNELTAFAEV